MARTMKIVPTTENRSDEATRNFELEDAPILHDETTRFRTGTVPYTWRPTGVVLNWRNGTLKKALLKGFRIKKDGTLGKVAAHRMIKIVEGQAQKPLSHGEMDLTWIQSIIDLFGDVPAFTPLDKPSWAQGETPYAETTIIVRDDA